MSAKYQIINGTFYNAETPIEVIQVMELARKERRRLKLYYGNHDTGKDWMEENDTIGYIGRSTGEIKIPLLIVKANSIGGGAILDNMILKIKESKGSKILYKAANYLRPVIHIENSVEPGYSYSLRINSEIYSNHKTEAGAKRLKTKLS